MVIRMVQPLLLSSYKLRLRVWACGQWRKRYGSNMIIPDSDTYIVLLGISPSGQRAI